jgi:DNA-binding CsgD family transcriptional regulator
MVSSPGRLLAETANATDVATVVGAGVSALRAAIGAGPVFLATADPVSGVFSSTFTFDIPQEAASAFFANELTGRDVVTFRSLTTTSVPVDALFHATGGDPRQSPRWRDIIAPLGWGDELRAAIRTDEVTWGYLCLHRTVGERPFSARDAQRLAELVPTLGHAIRRAALAAAPHDVHLESGVILVDEHARLIGTTGGASAWLDELGPPTSGELPLLVAALSRQVVESGRPASSAITTRSGQSGLLEAALLEGGHTRQVVVVISSTPPEHRLQRLAAAGRLTPREVEIIECVLAADSTTAIARTLNISPNTVQAHLTSIFAKTGLRSRRELLGRLRH